MAHISPTRLLHPQLQLQPQFQAPVAFSQSDQFVVLFLGTQLWDTFFIFFFHLAAAVGIPEVCYVLLCLAIWTHPSPVGFFGSWQALTMNSTLTQLFLRLGLAKSNWKLWNTKKKTWLGLSSCFNPRVWMRNDRPFVSICIHLSSCQVQQFHWWWGCHPSGLRAGNWMRLDKT